MPLKIDSIVKNEKTFIVVVAMFHFHCCYINHYILDMSVPLNVCLIVCMYAKHTACLYCLYVSQSHCMSLLSVCEPVILFVSLSVCMPNILYVSIVCMYASHSVCLFAYLSHFCIYLSVIKYYSISCSVMFLLNIFKNLLSFHL